jgi:hypothetical protein
MFINLLTVGSHPRSFNFHTAFNQKEIPLDVALNPTELQKHVRPEDVIAVIGSSHSSVLVMKNLYELKQKPKCVKNFYREELKYAVHKQGYILFDNTGLKELAAEWARNNLEKPIPFVKRFMTSDESEKNIFKSEMPGCNKIIYGVGFSSNPLPIITFKKTIDPKTITYDKLTGQLVAGSHRLDGLFGYGIAFPEQTKDPEGNQELAVGMWKFMKYIKRIIPTVVVDYINTNKSNL